MIIGVIVAFLFICLKSQSTSTTPLNAQSNNDSSFTRQSNIFPSAPPAYDSIYPDLNDNNHNNQYQSAPPPPPGFKTNFNSRDHTSSSSSSGWSSFLTGAALGSAGTYLLNRNRNK
jgi:hypothetical protein